MFSDVDSELRSLGFEYAHTRTHTRTRAHALTCVRRFVQLLHIAKKKHSTDAEVDNGKDDFVGDFMVPTPSLHPPRMRACTHALVACAGGG